MSNKIFLYFKSGARFQLNSDAVYRDLTDEFLDKIKIGSRLLKTESGETWDPYKIITSDTHLWVDDGESSTDI